MNKFSKGYFALKRDRARESLKTRLGIDLGEAVAYGVYICLLTSMMYIIDRMW